MAKPRTKSTTPKPKKLGLFDHLREIYEVQSVGYFDSLTDAEKKSYSNYLINRFISMNWNYVEVVNEFQQYYGEVGSRESYLFFSQVLPRGKQFNRYIKPKAEKSYEDWLVERIGSHFLVNHREAEGYLELYLATPEGRARLRELLESYGTETKLLRRVLG